MIFNFLSSFRQRGDNFFETTFILTNILIRIVALYIVQQFVNELVSKLTGSLPIHHQPHIPADMTGVNMAYPYAPTYPMPMPSQSHGAPPKYEDVVKEPFNSNPA
jgi:Cu/Ag efflux pump CusA